MTRETAQELVHAATTEAGMIGTARRLGEVMRMEDGVGEAVAAIEGA